MPLRCSNRSYSFLDARLYDDETLTVVLQAQEENENKLRLLAQLPLGPALSCGEEFIWDPELRYLTDGKIVVFFFSFSISAHI